MLSVTRGSRVYATWFPLKRIRIDSKADPDLSRLAISNEGRLYISSKISYLLYLK
jgi:hypothetical protein